MNVDIALCDVELRRSIPDTRICLLLICADLDFGKFKRPRLSCCDAFKRTARIGEDAAAPGSKVKLGVIRSLGLSFIPYSTCRESCL